MLIPSPSLSQALNMSQSWEMLGKGLRLVHELDWSVHSIISSLDGQGSRTAYKPPT